MAPLLSEASVLPADTAVTIRALQHAILGSTRFSLIATDSQGVIQLFNLGAERMLGYKAAEVVGRIRPSDIHDPAEVIERARALTVELGTPIAPGFQALAFKASRGIEDIYELTYICKDGSRFPAIVSITALRDDNQTLIGYLLIGTHNAVRKAVELELNGAVSLADEANLAKSEFLSNMSHELRTPLNAILGFAQLLDGGLPAPTVAQKLGLDQIQKAGWYLLDLINEILDLAQIESGKLSISVEPLLIADVMRESRAMIEPQAEKRRIQLKFPPSDAPYRVQADRTRVKQVLINLLSNAVKYNSDSGTITVEYAIATEGRLRISVSDTGEGLSVFEISQLFQPFNRLRQEGRVGEGTGIGLVVCKRLMELMGGMIGVRSTVGEGSVFWVELNLASDLQIAGRAASCATSQDSNFRAPSALRTLLYVEDNPANLLLVEEILAPRPWIQLLAAADGARGVELAFERLPDVILMDVNLPGISGVDALRILARDARTSRIPVIALSANASPRDIAKGLEAGFSRYLTKPIKVSEFLKTLEDVLESGKRVMADDRAVT